MKMVLVQLLVLRSVQVDGVEISKLEMSQLGCGAWAGCTGRLCDALYISKG